MASLCTVLFKKGLASRINLHQRLYPVLQSYRQKSSTTKEIDQGPIKYTKSPASKWRAETSRTGWEDTRLWYEPYVILASLSVFLIYFCILREENDIDLELNMSLYKRIKGLEETQLIASLNHNEQYGLDTKDIINRLEEIQLEKQQK